MLLFVRLVSSVERSGLKDAIVRRKLSSTWCTRLIVKAAFIAYTAIGQS